MCCKSNEMTDSLRTDSISADTALQCLSAQPQHSISSWKKVSAQQIIIVNKPLFDGVWQNCEVTVKMLIFFSCLVKVHVFFSLSSVTHYEYLGASILWSNHVYRPGPKALAKINLIRIVLSLTKLWKLILNQILL